MVNTCGFITVQTPIVVDASSSSSNDGSVGVKATYQFDGYATNGDPRPHTSLQFSLDNINWFDAALEISDGYRAFFNLLPGNYTVYVRARKTTSSAWEYCSNVFTIGFTVADCSTLTLGTISTVGESAPGAHNGSITVGSSGLYAREFRLDAGAWQPSNVFNGLAAGTYNVQVRYIAYPTCVLNRSVNLVTCDVAITSIVVTNETAKFAEDGTILINNTGAAAPFQYSIDNGVNWSPSNAFSGLMPDTYSVKVKDANGCIDSRSVTVLKARSLYFKWPLVNNHRFVPTSGPIADGLPQNFDNTLFRSMRYIGSVTDEYKEKFQLNDSGRVQWRSSYSNHLMEVRRYSDGFLISSLPIVKQRAFQGQDVETLAKLADATGGKVQVFFADELPMFAVVGQELTISDTGTALDGQTHKIESVTNGTGDASGYVVLILTAVWPGGAAIDCHIEANYDILPYDVFECAIDYSALAANDYFLRLTCTDPQLPTSVGDTEPFTTSVKVDDGIEIVFFNNDNGFNMYYDTAIQNLIRVVAEIRLGEPGGQNTLMEDSNRDLVTLMEYVTRNVEITIPDIPNYLRERISLAIAHDVIRVNGVYYKKEDKPSHTPGTLDDLATMTIKLRQLDFIAENSDDGGMAFSPDNPRIHDYTFDETFN